MQAVTTGTTTVSARGDVMMGVGGYCAYDPTQMNVPITVQVPTSLQVLNVTVLPNGSGPPNGCPTSKDYRIMVDHFWIAGAPPDFALLRC